MNGESVHPVVVRDIVKSTGHGSTGGVHKNVETIEFLDDLSYAMAAAGRVGYVSFYAPNGRTMSFDKSKTFWFQSSARS